MDIKCSFLHFIRSTHFLLSQQRQIRGFKEDKRTLNPESLTVCVMMSSLPWSQRQQFMMDVSANPSYMTKRKDDEEEGIAD